jgi:uncharacterized repeat protein (TIGR03803 family)
MKSPTECSLWVVCRYVASAALTLVVALGLGMVSTHRAQAQTYQTYKEKVLYNFTGGADGKFPDYGALIWDAKGNLYGTTAAGGADRAGVVFKLSSKNKETVLYSFTGGPDGGTPWAGLVMDAKGNLYGTTTNGGVRDCYNGSFCGVVFKVSSKGKETVLRAFTGADGNTPVAPLIFDAIGNLYGTTTYGGTGDGSGCGGVQYHCGVVFKVSGKGKETVLYSFTGGTDGANPTSGLIMDAKGNFYGTTKNGGMSGCGAGCGVVFKVSSKGKETVLYSFTGGTDGANPRGGVIMDAKGNLYGTTEYGGDVSGCGCGTVFSLDTTGKETVLYTFRGEADGGYPLEGLIFDAEGNLYGTTLYGGDVSACGGNGCGTVFKVSGKGKETVLYRFTGVADGSGPSADLIWDAKGNLYSTTSDRDAAGWGAVFKLTP